MGRAELGTAVQIRDLDAGQDVMIQETEHLDLMHLCARNESRYNGR